MVGKTALVYDDDYLNYQFGVGHPLQPLRIRLTIDTIRRLNLLDGTTELIQPQPATEDDLLLVHSKEYIEFVRKMSREERGYLDYGDTPATKGIYEATRRVVGGSMKGADLIMSGGFSHAFNPAGGLHHAKEDAAAGFCVFNDIAIAARHLQKRYGVKKIAILDVDGHHADGTQEIFYTEPILKVSLHRIGIFPGTGYVSELGEGEGKGYSVNVPLPEGTDDEAYLYAFNELVPPLIERYEPEVLLLQFGVDGHYQDPLVGLSLTTRTYREVASTVHNLAHKYSRGRLLVFGGGGYNPRNVTRCWAVMFATVSGGLTKASESLFKELFDGESPPRNSAVFENVKKMVKRVKDMVFPLHGL